MRAATSSRSEEQVHLPQLISSAWVENLHRHINAIETLSFTVSHFKMHFQVLPTYSCKNTTQWTLTTESLQPWLIYASPVVRWLVSCNSAPRTMTADQLSPIDGERTMSVQHRRPAVACRANSWLTVDQISGVAEVSPRSRAAPCLRCHGVVCVCFASQLLSLCSVAWRFLI